VSSLKNQRYRKYKPFHKKEEEERTPNSFYKATITPIPRQDKNATKQEKLQINFLDEHRCKQSQ
jgi:hypothetical protein